MTNLRIGSLCSGVGGFDLGLEMAGVGTVVWQVEIDAFCRSVLAQHWPDAKRYRAVESIGRTQHVVPVDVIVGGFPCQDLSVAGSMAGLLEGERSSLFFEVARVVSVVRPRYVLLENVVGVLGDSYGVLVGTLAALGYSLWWDCLPAGACGAPHVRDRWFCIGWLADASGQPGERRRGGSELAGQKPEAGEEGESPAVASPGDGGSDVAHTHRQRRQQGKRGVGDASGRAQPDDRDAEAVGNAHSPGLALGASLRRHLHAEREAALRAGGVWHRGERGTPQPGVVRAPDGVPEGLDSRPAEAWEQDVPRLTDEPHLREARLTALGNAVSPIPAKVIGLVLLDLHAILNP